MMRYARPFPPAAILLGALLAWIAACDSDRAITTAPVGEPAYGITFVLSPTNMPRGAARIPRPTQAPDVNLDTVTLTLQGLDTLGTGAYVVWLVDSAGTRFRRATGILTRTVTDTTIVAERPLQITTRTSTFTNVSSFSTGGPGHTLVFRTTRGLSGLTVADSIHTVVLSIEDDASATSPSSRRPLWARRNEGTDLTPPGGRRVRNTPMRFGNFRAKAESSYVYVPVGRGRVLVRSGVIVVNDSGLARPPLGYYYATFAFRWDTAAPSPRPSSVAVDTFFLGPQTAPYPERSTSLFDADTLRIAPSVQVLVLPPDSAGPWPNAAPSAIIAASTRAQADTGAWRSRLTGGSQPFIGFSQVFVTLEAKNAVRGRMGPAILLRQTLPSIIRLGHT